MTESFLAPASALWAQHALPAAMPSGSASAFMITLLAAMILAIPLLAIVLGVRQSRYEREVEHRERMKALELGRSLPRDASFWSPNTLCAAMGIILPLALFALAFSFTRFMKTEDTEAVWVFASLTAMTGMICGTVLAVLLPRREPAPSDTKPMFDPDALDTTSRRSWAEEPSPLSASS
jgi:putative exporter of polyketide antibiotics